MASSGKSPNFLGKIQFHNVVSGYHNVRIIPITVMECPTSFNVIDEHERAANLIA
jgi:hypothetical protein